jgi:hypothetical protein
MRQTSFPTPCDQPLLCEKSLIPSSLCKSHCLQFILFFGANTVKMDIASMWSHLQFRNKSSEDRKGWAPVQSGESSIDGSEDSEKLFLDEEDGTEPHGEIGTPKNKTSRSKQTSLVVLLLSVIAVAAVSVWPRQILTRDPVLDCGNSPEEAAAAGCTFDILESAWVHPECMDMELQNKYNPLGIWTFYEDETSATQLSDERVAAGVDRMLYTQPGFHQAHCVYIFDKMVRAIMSGKPVNTRMLRESHVNHCAMQMLILKHQFNESRTTVGRNYLPCDWTYL